MNEKMWVCYVIGHQNQRFTYCGMSNNVTRRLRQHNGEIKGGARYTSQVHKGVWTPMFHVTGFQSRRQVAQFEWAMKKRKSKRRVCAGREGRVQQLEYLLGLGRLNAEYQFRGMLRVVCFMKQSEYMRLSGMRSLEVFDQLRKDQQVPFFFREY